MQSAIPVDKQAECVRNDNVCSERHVTEPGLFHTVGPLSAGGK